MDYSTRDGRMIEIGVHEQDPNDTRGVDEGWVVHRFEAYVGGVCVGHLKVTYVPSSKAPDMWTWTIRNHSHTTKTWDLVDTWIKAHQYARMRPKSITDYTVSPCSITRDMAPSEKVMRKDLATLDKVFGYTVKYNAWRAQQVDRPFVDFISVYEGNRKQGISIALYDYAARWLALRNLFLCGSTLVLDEAVNRNWAKLKEMGCPVGTLEISGGKYKVPTLDYRMQAAA